MTAATRLDSLLSARHIVLWLEDKLAKEYLSRIWQPDDSLFQMLIAGSSQSVEAVVHDLRKSGHKNVFGVIDRDFRPSNRSQWKNPSAEMAIFRPERLEMENYALDWAALEACRANAGLHNRTREDIRQRARKMASNLLWWMACRRVISHYHDRVTGDFPRHPGMQAVHSLEDAEAYITTARNWWKKIPAEVEAITNPDDLRKRLQSAHDDYQEDMESERWTITFSGKEIFREIRGFLTNRRYASPEVMDTDLAKSVADWQIKNKAMPSELIELKDAIKMRAGVPDRAQAPKQ